MRLTLRLLGLDILDLDWTTDPDDDKPTEPQLPHIAELGIAAEVHADPPPERSMASGPSEDKLGFR
jgi:hypothetical protein